MAMSKAQIIAAVAESAGITKAQSKIALEKLVELAYAGAAEGGFTVPGLGKIALAERAERQGRNLATGETITIPAHTVVKFRFAKVAKEFIKPID